MKRFLKLLPLLFACFCLSASSDAQTKAVIKTVETNEVTEPVAVPAPLLVKSDGATKFSVDTDGATAIGPAGTPIKNVFSAQALLDFPETAPGTFSELTISVTGAMPGDVVALGVPPEAMTYLCNIFYCAWVSAPDTVTVRFCNCCPPIDPPPALFRACVIRFD